MKKLEIKIQNQINENNEQAEDIKELREKVEVN